MKNIYYNDYNNGLLNKDKYMVSKKIIFHMVLKILVVVNRYVEVKHLRNKVKSGKTGKIM